MKNKKQSKKAVAYYRTATTKQSGNTIAVQKNQCRKWAKKNGYKIVKEYEEVGSGSKLSNQKALVDVIARCQNKIDPIDVLLVTDIDRLSRNTVELLFIKSQIDLNGTKVIAVNQQPVDDMSSGKLLEGILEGFNDFYSKINKKERRYCEYCGNLL